ncbi:bifunctional 23S rRNA (guanine(2069)-N(7))-methyltransferase RlmK/23S rRNA (guanine(2445)-N(2))-methyltransferase RlmL [Paraliomyxa miuraensis]|uniref:bifunctional 23S rRNA (guanine(2069)-N(7))-methyltransferase RlmK/23S rRNA (guanine(2445)-N(2))-methyltransferase RlmL n=1 Tax=Paraliomyxa miuraensis TaxID=376150 RepID=UPI00224D7086|nr:bifunctional 23S rRNA (guanine(2069)-N(7))-methyltransferase RlmK/23S rRNA (guanine(2445)-N(2))-methyltransferase RlmL [Paraliomyxa miuraensis]MCX4247561.1 bifunctional 23S rRNA (guanine(2069)-N(7))-methyltransferase RlmK/23S rRNA (guanine(2445)-N(2))-methyltransferase RlmL [Paraliomyxa miuraensis]
MTVHSFFVTAPRGLVDVLAQELRTLGARVVRTEPGGCRVRGPLSFGYRICLWSRVANRVLLHLADLAVPDADALYEGVRAIAWEEHLSPDGTLAVDYLGVRAAVDHDRFGMQRVKDAIVDRFRDRTGRRPSVDPKRPDLRINAFARGGGCSVAIDLGGESLHRRGYRREHGAAPLKENLAAGLLQWGGWPQVAAGGGAFVDPMAGAATLAIEAAWMADDVAPGLRRSQWGFSAWHGHDAAAWAEVRREALERAVAGTRSPRVEIQAYDGDADIVRLARTNIARAGLSDRILLDVRPLRQWKPGDAPPQGLLALNPPYGERLGDKADLRGLYGRLGRTLLRCFPDWRALVLTSDDALRHAVGLVPEQTLAVDNGPLPCTVLRYTLPPSLETASGPALASSPTKAGAEAGAGPEAQAKPRPEAQAKPAPSPVPPRLSEADRHEVAPFVNRLRKGLRTRERWAEREGVTCFRLYDADVPEFNVAIDRYERWLHVQEYEAPSRVDPERAARRIDLVIASLPELTGVDPEHVVLKRRRRQRGREQYRPLALTGHRMQVKEGGHRFWVNLHDYLDTGLFLDHRTTRRWIEQRARGKRFLNLFAYTGSATVHAMAGGAEASTTVDLSNTYLDWAQANLELNGLEPGARHRLVRADVRRFLEEDRGTYDLVFLDPPTTSTSKKMEERFEVGRDHVALIEATMARVVPGGELLFSTNSRRFVLDARVSERWAVEDLTFDSLPPDFRREPPIHRLWRITARGG